jgi:hypothetical protein
LEAYARNHKILTCHALKNQKANTPQNARFSRENLDSEKERRRAGEIAREMKRTLQGALIA